MKPNQLLAIIFLGSVLPCFGQVFYKSSNKKEFKNLIQYGVVYIKSDNEHRDSTIIESLKKNWTCTKQRIYDPASPAFKLKDDDVVLLEASFTSPIGDKEHILILIEYKFITDNQISKFSSVGYFCLNGFDQTDKSDSEEFFMDFSIIGLNDVVKTIQKNAISGMGNGLYKEIWDAFKVKTHQMKSKTLLLIGDTKTQVDTKALTKNGVKYKEITLEEFKEYSDNSDYCLLYFADNSYTEISIFDLEKNELIYSRHFFTALGSLGSSEIKDIVKSWD